MQFLPKQVFFEPGADSYPLGIKLLKEFETMGIPVKHLKTYNRLDPLDKTPQEFYAYAKSTLVVGVKRSMKLEHCSPSADYQFSMVTGCPGSCEYCYLQTNQSLKPFIRIYANIEEIFETLQKYINTSIPEITTFEAASTSDPLSVEHITGSVRKAVEFFSGQKFGRLRLVTKFSSIDSLLDIKHNNHTKVRFSLNSKYVINTFEHNTDSLDNRIAAAGKIYSAGYPLGFILAPLMHYRGWKQEYTELLEKLRDTLSTPDNAEITFELIQYRFTTRARNVILERFPKTSLDMDEENRIKKWGPYGIFKYVYPKDISEEIKSFLQENIKKHFPKSSIEYFT